MCVRIDLFLCLFAIDRRRARSINHITRRRVTLENGVTVEAVTAAAVQVTVKAMVITSTAAATVATIVVIIIVTVTSTVALVLTVQVKK